MGFVKCCKWFSEPIQVWRTYVAEALSTPQASTGALRTGAGLCMVSIHSWRPERLPNSIGSEYIYIYIYIYV